MRLLNFHDFSPCLCVHVSRNLSALMTAACCLPWEMFSGHHRDLLNMNSPDRQTRKQSTRGDKYLSRKLDFYISHVRHAWETISSPTSEIGFAPLCVEISALSVHVCGKLFMHLIKMNVFICLLSTKKRSAPAKSGDVWWDEMRACSSGRSGTQWCWIAEGSK